MTTEIAIEKLINLAPVIADLKPKIQENAEVNEFMQKYKQNENKDNLDFMLAFLPVLYKYYKDEIFNILAIWEGVTVEEIKNQSFAKTVASIKALVEDEDFKSFFTVA